MDKANVLKTQEMWKDYENTMFWLNTINNPQDHMIIRDNKVVGVDHEYRMALESLNYILTGKQILNTVIANKTTENSKATTVISSILSSVPKEKLLRHLEEIERELSDWHISAHKCTVLYEEKADIEKELAHRNISIENSSKQFKSSSKPSEPSYEVVYSDYDDIGLAIEVNGYFPKKVLCHFGFTINGDLEEYGGVDLIDWHHTNIYLTKEEWRRISYKKSPELIFQELNINTEKTYSQSMTK